DVSELWIPEESAYDTGEFLEAAKRADGLRLEVARAHDDAAADPVVLYVVPDPFIGVKIRRVRRQEEYTQAPGSLLLHELAHLLGRQLADPRVNGFLPFRHAFRILLISAVQRPLRRQAHLLEQPADLDL